VTQEGPHSSKQFVLLSLEGSTCVTVYILKDRTTFMILAGKLQKTLKSFKYFLLRKGRLGSGGAVVGSS
jgi:hypothetical protein